MPEILNNKRSILALMLIAALSVYWFLLKPNSLDLAGTEIISQTPSSSEPLPGAPVPGGPAEPSEDSVPPNDGGQRGALPPSGPLPRDSEDQFQTAFRQCVPGSSKNYPDLRALLVDLEKSVDPPPEKQWENFQIRLPNGDIRRIMLVPRENGTIGATWELRYFGVDAENLPVKMPLPETIRGIEDLDRLLAMGKTVGHQVSERYVLTSGEEVLLERHNDEIVDFQWRRIGASLVCSTEVCRCLSANGNGPSEPSEVEPNEDSPDEPVDGLGDMDSNGVTPGGDGVED